MNDRLIVIDWRARRVVQISPICGVTETVAPARISNRNTGTYIPTYKRAGASAGPFFFPLHFLKP
jgi:hypothetical protein